VERISGQITRYTNTISSWKNELEGLDVAKDSRITVKYCKMPNERTVESGGRVKYEVN